MWQPKRRHLAKNADGPGFGTPIRKPITHSQSYNHPPDVLCSQDTGLQTKSGGAVMGI